MRWSKAPTKAAEPVPEGPWPSGKYQQDASTFEELARAVERQQKVRAMEIAAGDSLTPQEEALKKIQEKFSQVSSETRVDLALDRAPSPTVLEVDVEVLPRTPSLPSPAAPSPDSRALQTTERTLSPAAPAERGIDQILHELLHEKKWLTPAERAKLDRAYQMEKHRAGLTQNPDPMKPIHFRRFVPPERPPGFWAMSSTNRMWYCRMEELWQFRQEDAAKAQLANSAPAGNPTLTLPAPVSAPAAKRGRSRSRKKKRSC